MIIIIIFVSIRWENLKKKHFEKELKRILTLKCSLIVVGIKHVGGVQCVRGLTQTGAIENLY